MIRYQHDLEGVTLGQLTGFFAGWPNPPSAETHLRLLQGSSAFVLAIDEGSGEVVGFVTAVSDGVLSAFIPLLEVKDPHRRRGIGGELVRRLVERLSPLYMIDLSCDAGLRSLYEGFGFRAGTAMMLRDYDAQSGA